MVQKRHKTTLKPKRRGNAVPPDAVLRLMEAIGPSRAAREIGTSNKTLFEARKNNIVSKSLEVAAAAVLRDVAGEMSSLARMEETAAPVPAAVAPVTQRRVTAESSMFLIEVPADKAAMVRKVVEMAHGKLLEP